MLKYDHSCKINEGSLNRMECNIRCFKRHMSVKYKVVSCVILYYSRPSLTISLSHLPFCQVKYGSVRIIKYMSGVQHNSE